uniref:LisH domain-containing protein n=1 Tax=Rhabditophanes sp. KR3021 TaxID=114890 RepID=A0AC35U343_9BILA
MATLFSDELNYLIYRYLQENGFVHTAYTLSCEAGIASSNIDGSKAPNGSLVTIVQKGVLYAQAEVQEFLAEKGDSGESVENVKLSLLDSVTPNNPNIDASYVRKGNNDKFHSNNINGAFAEDGIKSMSLMNGSLKEYQNMNLIHLASTSRNAEYDYMDTSGPGPIKTREKTPNIRNNLDRQKRDNDINVSFDLIN